MILIHFSQAKRGYMTESDTDTEVIVKLLKLIYDRDQQSVNEKKLSFPELVEQVILQLVRNVIPFTSNLKKRCILKQDYLR